MVSVLIIFILSLTISASAVNIEILEENVTPGFVVVQVIDDCGKVFKLVMPKDKFTYKHIDRWLQDNMFKMCIEGVNE